MKFVHLLTALLLAAPVAPIILAEDAPAGSTAVDDAKGFEFPKEGDPLKVLELDDVKEMVKGHDADLLVVNFWATWCAPCVAELPYFAAVDQQYRQKGVRIVGLTLDNLTYPDWPEISAKTLKDRGVKYSNFALDADPNVFVPWFAEEWVGAIPATFYFDKEGNKVGQRLRDVTREELQADIEQYLPKETAADGDAEEAETQSSSSTEKS